MESQSPGIVGRVFGSSLRILWHSAPADVTEEYLMPILPTRKTLPWNHLQKQKVLEGIQCQKKKKKLQHLAIIHLLIRNSVNIY